VVEEDWLGGYQNRLGRPLRTRQEEGLAALRNLAAGITGSGRLTAIIPAHNEAATIAGTIRSLRRQTEPPDRIIVVCDDALALAYVP
jgi:cellulose synthase/poly-beta-1,6-N-acetylglucosamine synthase-like glycosyltransferase